MLYLNAKENVIDFLRNNNGKVKSLSNESFLQTPFSLKFRNPMYLILVINCEELREQFLF